MNTVVESAKECVLEHDIKREIQTIVQVITSNLVTIQGVCINLVVKYVVPSIIKFSKDAIAKGEFLYGLVQFLSKVKLSNIMAKLATKHAILTTLVNYGSNTSIR